MKIRAARTKLTEDALFDFAVRSLAARACSSDELRFKMRQRAARISDIEPAISRLKDLGYLDDKRFAELYTSMRVENDGFGRARVLSDLRGRRVAPKVAEQAVSRAFEDKNELDMVAAYVERRMPSIFSGGHHTGEPKEDERKLAAAYRKLRRAGFAPGPILTVLKRFAAHPELLDEPPPEDDPADD